MHLQPVFLNSAYYGNDESEQLFLKGLCLPSGSNLTEADLSRVCKIIVKELEC
jgi:dTDP-4-amino-4,6-dideoxygalactose transaminase